MKKKRSIPSKETLLAKLRVKRLAWKKEARDKGEELLEEGGGGQK